MSPKMNLHKMNLFGIIITLNLANLALSEPHHWADNVCNESVPVKKDLVVEQPVQYEIKVHSMCGLLPCVKTRLESRTDQSIKTVVQYVNKVTCCPGYAETLSRRCSPICSDPCGPGGNCIEPNVCKCHQEPSQSAPGYTGPTCRKYHCLDSARWGANCELECRNQCDRNSYCMANTGRCVCNPGWHGPNCSLECGPDDSMDSGCNFMSQTSSAIEPDANFLVSNENNMVVSRTQKAEALILTEDGNDDVKIISKPSSLGSDSQAWAGLASSYIIGLLSVMSLILLIAFLIVKKRYEFVRNELYYASVASIGSRSDGGTSGGPGSVYSTSTYYSANRGLSSSPSSINEKNPDKELNFAAATRNTITGFSPNQIDGKRTLMLSPKTESHLIRSQKASEQNIYSEIDLVKESSKVANRPRAETPKVAKQNNDDDEHIYQVPKRSPIMNSGSIPNVFNDSDLCIATDDSMLKTTDVSLRIEDDDDSNNIYEEITPRTGSANKNL